MILLYFIIIIVLILIIVLLSTYKINIILKIKDEHSYFCIKFIALKGLIKYKYEIPYIDLMKYKQKLILNLVKIETKDRQLTTDHKLNLDEIKHYIKLFFKYKKIYSSVIKYLTSKLKVEKFRLFIDIGLNDAATTAIVFGFFNSLLSTILSIVSRNMNFKNIEVRNKPNFNKGTIDLNFNCIIIFSLVNIINARYKFLKIKKAVS